MDDKQIVQLFWDREETAIPATAEKYGDYCTAIARNILRSVEDAEECVNDTYLQAWNAIPPNRPLVLRAFLGKITRNLCFNRYKQGMAEKRGGGELPVVLEELAEVVSCAEDTQQLLDQKELSAAINAFLSTLSPEKRRIFVGRYWYADSVTTMAQRYGMREGTISMQLNRLRKQLKIYLTERGFDL